MQGRTLKTKAFRFSLTPGEYTALRHLATREGLSLAAVLRMLIRGEARRRQLWPEEESSSSEAAPHFYPNASTSEPSRSQSAFSSACRSPELSPRSRGSISDDIRDESVRGS